MTQLDLKKIEAYPVDIESFNYDVPDMVNSIYIGPQGDLLEKIDDFNGKFGSDIGVTKSFTLKPGGYDSIKSAYNRWVLRYDLRPRGISSIFNRIRDYSWRSNMLKTDLLGIEDKMKNLKASGLRWQDNTNDLIVEIDKTKENIVNGIEKAKELYPDVDVSVKMLPTKVNRLSLEQRRRSYYGRQVFPPIVDDASHATDFIVTYYIHMHNVVMKTHILSVDETINTYDTPCGDIIIISGTYLLPMISRNWGNTESSSDLINGGQYSYFLDAIHLDPMKLNRHPYIGTSTDKYAWDLDATIYGYNICQGNMAVDIKSTMINGQVEAHITHLVTWLTNHYVPQTNPLNRIHMLKNVGKNKLHIGFAENDNARDTFNRNPLESWRDCVLPDQFKHVILGYGTDDATNYGHSYNRIRIGGVKYCERVYDYLNRIDLNDMPCNECLFQKECEISQIIFMILKDDAFTPEEEGYIGMFIEWNKRSQINHDTRGIYFAEEAVILAGLYKMAEQYDDIFIKKMAIDSSSVAEAFEDTAQALEVLENARQDMISEDLTPEQRTIQWASRQGGATNL